MAVEFEPGDFLVFQLESAFAVARVLGVDDADTDPIWHLTVYESFFFDIDTAEAGANGPSLPVAIPQLALTDRAFHSTQVAKIASRPLTPEELEPLNAWLASSDHEIFDRSIRLMMGFR